MTKKTVTTNMQQKDAIKFHKKSDLKNTKKDKLGD